MFACYRLKKSRMQKLNWQTTNFLLLYETKNTKHELWFEFLQFDLSWKSPNHSQQPAWEKKTSKVVRTKRKRKTTHQIDERTFSKNKSVWGKHVQLRSGSQAVSQFNRLPHFTEPNNYNSIVNSERNEKMFWPNEQTNRDTSVWFEIIIRREIFRLYKNTLKYIK